MERKKKRWAVAERGLYSVLHVATHTEATPLPWLTAVLSHTDVRPLGAVCHPRFGPWAPRQTAW